MKTTMTMTYDYDNMTVTFWNGKDSFVEVPVDKVNKAFLMDLAEFMDGLISEMPQK